MAHRVDLGPGLRRAGREQVALGDRVGAVRLRVDAEDLAFEAVGVGRAALVVPAAAARPLVGVGLEVVARVVADGDVEIAVAVPGHAAARVAAGLPLGGEFDHHLLGVRDQDVVADFPTADDGLGGGRVVIEEVDVAVVRELRIDGHARKALLLVALGVDREDAHGFHAGDFRVVDFERAPAFGDVDAAVFQHLEDHRLIERALGQDDGAEAVEVGLGVGIDGGGPDGRSGDKSDQAGHKEAETLAGGSGAGHGGNWSGFAV